MRPNCTIIAIKINLEGEMLPSVLLLHRELDCGPSRWGFDVKDQMQGFPEVEDQATRAAVASRDLDRDRCLLARHRSSLSQSALMVVSLGVHLRRGRLEAGQGKGERA